MRSFVLVLLFVAVAFLSWGAYGPTLHHGQQLLGGPAQPSGLRAFLCVGLAYFAIAVVAPVILLRLNGEAGQWTWPGAFWSLAAGAAGALGALGIILAFKFRGRPVYVMPLVFGLAPVVNTFVTMWMGRTFRQASAIFYAGVILVAVGAAGVLFFKPAAAHATVATATEHTNRPAEAPAAHNPFDWQRLVMVPLAVALSALCWGSYGPILHKGQMKMAGSRLRPFLCVGLAYFAIAVVWRRPLLLNVFNEPGTWATAAGVSWSLAGGAAGAVGALGIIMAFNFGGKPIYVMPLVFGGAPVVNTFITIVGDGNMHAVGVPFFSSLLLVIGGAVTVLIFAPRGSAPHAAAPPKSAPEQLEDGEDVEDTYLQEDTIDRRFLDGN